MGKKKFLVVMTNGDTYTVSADNFERTQEAMRKKETVVGVYDTVSNLKLTLLVANISAAVERTEVQRG